MTPAEFIAADLENTAREHDACAARLVARAEQDRRLATELRAYAKTLLAAEPTSATASSEDK